GAQGPGRQVAVTIPADGLYHWQARTVDNSGIASAWVSFGGNPENPPTNPAATDISLDLVPDPPAINPATVQQFQSDGTTPIGVGGNATTAGVFFSATGVD